MRSSHLGCRCLFAVIGTVCVSVPAAVTVFVAVQQAREGAAELERAGEDAINIDLDVVQCVGDGGG
jgi:hypothetical protein